MTEFGALGALICKRLNHANTRERILQLRIHLRDLLAIITKDSLHVEILAHHNHHENGSHHSHRARKSRADGKQNHKRANDLDAADNEPLGQVVSALADIKQVVDHTTHHVSRTMAVKIGKAKALILIE